MTSAIRALLAVASIGTGWALMVVASDKPQWIYQFAAVIGVALVLGGAIWWGVAERRSTEREIDTSNSRKDKP